MFYVYLISSVKDKNWYTGYTQDLQKRILEHNQGRNFATRNRGPFKLIYYEVCINEKDARAREKYLKTGMGKKYLRNRLKFFFDS